ncbi:unnamed protein product [Clonostachys solani]|uniref:Uncharacterized protein n=1 Tax=Clonostachys solani TaxID=160281 RepID=A0A9N9ZFB6_9HYPO|nr:unnamed protein product [Clonostachys solani]
MASAPRLRVPPKKSEARRGQGMEDDASGSGFGEAGHTTLLPFDAMPPWFQQDNNPWYLHNETVNIYSYLIPAIVFLLGEWYILQYLASKYSRVTGSNFIAFSFFILTATICYTFSALYYTLINHSYTVDYFYYRLDILGIGIFIVGDIILGIGVFGILTIIANIHPKLQSYKYRSKRTLAFIATGISIVAPLIHRLDIFGLDLMNKKAFTYTIVAKIGCLLSGTALYTVSLQFCPDWRRIDSNTYDSKDKWPRKFNIYSSHSFMHILVVYTAVIQMIGYLAAFDYAYSNITCSAS